MNRSSQVCTHLQDGLQGVGWDDVGACYRNYASLSESSLSECGQYAHEQAFTPLQHEQVFTPLQHEQVFTHLQHEQVFTHLQHEQVFTHLQDGLQGVGRDDAFARQVLDDLLHATVTILQ